MRLAVCSLMAGLLGVALAGAGDWPTFRGTDRLALSKETGLLQSWPAGGPPLAWETAGAGRGYASLAIAGDRIYTLGDALSTAEDKDEYLTCFNRADGKSVWKAKTGPQYTHRNESWGSSRGTPTVDGDRVYVITPAGKLVCCDTASGDEKWSKDLKADFGGKKADGWGYSESPLVDGDLVVCTPGGAQKTIVALDKISGDVKWEAARDNERGASHASIAIAEVGGTKVYVQLTGAGPMGVRATDGQVLWTYDFPRTTAIAPSPIVRGDLAFFTAGYGTGGALLKQVPGENGTVAVEEVYGLNSGLGVKHGGLVLVGDYLYGDSEDKGIPWCAELMTGQEKWKQRVGGGSISFAAADGCLYMHVANGKMILAKASPDAFQKLGEFNLPQTDGRPSWAHPVVVDGRLYVREGDRIYCYDVSAK